eukprot:6095652-Pleurochrysis_carterae.AAC.2
MCLSVCLRACDCAVVESGETAASRLAIAACVNTASVRRSRRQSPEECLRLPSFLVPNAAGPSNHQSGGQAYRASPFTHCAPHLSALSASDPAGQQPAV